VANGRGLEPEAVPERSVFAGRWWIWSVRMPIGWTVREPLARSLVIDQNVLRFRRRGAVLLSADRDEVDALELQTRSPGVGLLSSELRVRFADGSYAPVVMVPAAPRQLEHWLEQHGWAVEIRVVDPPGRTDIRALPTGGDGRTQPGSVYRREGTSTAKAVLLTVLVAVIVGGFVGLWLYAVAGPGGPDWRGYATAVLDGDEAVAREHLCVDVRRELRRLDGGFEQARIESLERFDGPVERYAGQRRGGSAFELEDGSAVVHPISWTVENDEPRMCPTDPSALLGTRPAG
jgi:hypothetical protein